MARMGEMVRVFHRPVEERGDASWQVPHARTQSDVHVLFGSKVMPIATTGVAEQLRSIGITILGIILSLVPPVLWVAWTETVLLVVVAVGVVSAASLVVLADSGTQDVRIERLSPASLQEEIWPISLSWRSTGFSH
jgi:hypothetical protein